jgi:hypothetical protein
MHLSPAASRKKLWRIRGRKCARSSHENMYKLLFIFCLSCPSIVTDDSTIQIHTPDALKLNLVRHIKVGSIFLLLLPRNPKASVTPRNRYIPLQPPGNHNHPERHREIQEPGDDRSASPASLKHKRWTAWIIERESLLSSFIFTVKCYSSFETSSCRKEVELGRRFWRWWIEAWNQIFYHPMISSYKSEILVPMRCWNWWKRKRSNEPTIYNASWSNVIQKIWLKLEFIRRWSRTVGGILSDLLYVHLC